MPSENTEAVCTISAIRVTAGAAAAVARAWAVTIQVRWCPEWLSPINAKSVNMKPWCEPG